jgi:hypothetical protein
LAASADGPESIADRSEDFHSEPRKPAAYEAASGATDLSSSRTTDGASRRPKLAFRCRATAGGREREASSPASGAKPSAGVPRIDLTHVNSYPFKYELDVMPPIKTENAELEFEATYKGQLYIWVDKQISTGNIT